MTRRIWQTLRKRPPFRMGIGALGGVLLVCLLADLIAGDLPVVARFRGHTFVLPALFRPPALLPYDNQRLRREMSLAAGDWVWMPLCEYGPEQQPQILRPPPASPDGTHWLGTDDRGRDVFARLVHGTRVSLAVGLVSVAIYVLIGLLLGVLGGYGGGRVDWLICRLIELGLTFPTFFLILIIMGLLERTSLVTLMVVLGLTRWTDVARLVRAEVLRLKQMDFILAARASGAGPAHVMFRHLVPNALSPVVVNATFGVASAILAEAALSFLGFGAPPPVASWGEVLGQAMQHPDRWWLSVCPGLLLFVTLMSLNLVGEALRDALDPRLRGVSP
jgi:peptide/nickel transport system permease protein